MTVNAENENEEDCCCRDCFENKPIRDYIEKNDTIGNCDFCGSEEVPLITVMDITEFIDHGIERKYEDAAEQVPCESAEGGYQMETYDIGKIFLDEVVFSGDRDISASDPDPLQDEIAELSKFGTVPLVKQDPFSSPYDTLDIWKEFCEEAKSGNRDDLVRDMEEPCRQHVVSPPADQDVDSPFPWLSCPETSASDACPTKFQAFWDLFRCNIVESCLRAIDVNTAIYRARCIKEGEPLEHAGITAPPAEIALAGRMNEKGIAYFYGAEDPDTCIAEVRPSVGERVAIGRFNSVKELTVLDLVNLPEQRSCFDEEYVFDLDEMVKPFLYEFSNAIAQPTDRDQDALDYVPTQLFCEFVRERYGYPPKVHGIRYRSAARKNGISWVLFRGADVSLGPDPWIELHEPIRYIHASP